jgi:glycosyltransferase involved in cell wall biosynthesis
MPEIIEEGVTGFLVSDVESAAAAVASAIRLDRSKVRRVAERRFSADRMIDDYLAVYAKILGEISGELFQRYRAPAAEP